MSEAADRLRHALQELEKAVETHADVDPEVLAKLEQAITGINAAILQASPHAEDDESAPPQTEEETLTGQLSGLAREFEVSHPTLSGMVGSVIDALARMGI